MLSAGSIRDVANNDMGRPAENYPDGALARRGSAKEKFCIRLVADAEAREASRDPPHTRQYAPVVLMLSNVCAFSRHDHKHPH